MLLDLYFWLVLDTHMSRWSLDSLFRRRAKVVASGLVRRGVSADLASDLVQDAFLRLMTSKSADDSGAREDDRPDSYLATVARNLAKDAARRARISPLSELPDDLAVRAPDPAPSPERALSDRQRLARAVAALDELPARTRRAFELNRLEGMTLAEVGRELGLSTSRAGARVKDAYDHLRQRTARAP